jgi:hypothetical protein
MVKKKERIRVSFRPTLIDLPKKRKEDDLHLRASNSKKDIGSFYVELYASIFGGVVSPRFKGRHEFLMNGDRRNMHPDILRKTPFGTDLLEIKSISNMDKRPSLSEEQVENLFYKFLFRIYSNQDSLPEFEQGVFHYGSASKYIHAYRYSTKDFIRILSKSTHNLVITPSNLNLFSYICSRKVSFDRESTKSEEKCVSYLRYPKWLSTALASISTNEEVADFFSGFIDAKPKQKVSSYGFFPEYITSMTEEKRKEIFIDSLMLDRLRVKTFNSSDLGDIFCQGYSLDSGEKYNHPYKVNPFKITQYYLNGDDRVKWLDNLRSNHRYLLEEVVGVRDLFYENFEASDSYELKSELVRQESDKGDLPF